MTGRCLNGVRAVFSSSHNSPEGDDHGHDYEVWAYFGEGEDARQLRRELVAKLEDFDHRRLPDGLAWDNQLARHIGLHVGAVRVRVCRPVIGFEAVWEEA